MSDCAIPWTAVRQAPLSSTNSWSLLKLLPIELVMPSNHLILCRPLLPPSIFPSIRIFSNESALRIRWPKYWSFSFYITFSTRSHAILVSVMGDSAQSLQPCPTLCDPMDHGPPGSSVHGILQARTLEWVAISFSSNG